MVIYPGGLNDDEKVKTPQKNNEQAVVPCATIIRAVK